MKTLSGKVALVTGASRGLGRAIALSLGSAGSVVDDQIDLGPVLPGRIYALGRVLDHLRIKHFGDNFVERKSLSIGFVVCHIQRGHKPDDHLVSSVKELRSHLGKLLPKRRKPGPVGKDNRPISVRPGFLQGSLDWESREKVRKGDQT